MASTIFKGNFIKTLKDNLTLNDKTEIQQGTVDPTSVAVNAPIGSLYFNTTSGDIYKKNDAGLSTSWSKIAVGDNTGINYITNGSAEGSTTGWATYADAAAVRPVDGTGGTANVTWTRTTTTPLRGIASFLLTKDAVNRQGEGASYDFTISRADRAKSMQISFDYEIASGTFANGDLRVYIYDVTNAQLIEPAPTEIWNVSITSTWSGTFQTSATATSYRLIVHCASTSASAYSVEFDNVTVAPMVASTGTLITDWVSYPLTIGASPTPPTKGGTISRDEARWRRIGDSIQITYNFAQTAGGSNGSGNYLFPLPSGLTIDSTKIYTGGATAQGTVGTAEVLAGATVYSGNVAISDSSNLYLSVGNDTTAITPVRDSFCGLATTAIRYSFTALVPVVGWSSSQQTSADAAQRTVSLVAARSAVQSVSNATYTAVSWDTTVVNSVGASFSAGVYTVPVAGDYEVSAALEFAANGTGIREVVLYRNGVIQRVIARESAPSASTTAFVCGQFLMTGLVAGDTLEIRAYQTSGGALNIASNGTQYNYVNIMRIAAPEQIVVTEFVGAAARRQSTGRQSIPNNSFTTFIYNTEDFDSHDAYNSATGVFTAPVSGTYNVNASVQGVGLTANTGQIGFSILKNGSTINGVAGFSSIGASTEETTTYSYPLKLLRGETTAISAFQNNGAARDVQGFISIIRVGNY